jgi:ferredoxin
MKKINVSKEQCIGCGACVAIDSEHFNFDDNGRSSVISNDNLDSANLTNAIESCPTSAINIVDDIEGNSENDNDDSECSDCCHDCNCCHSN